MGERNINPIQNIHTSKKYKEVIFINPYSFGVSISDADALAFIAAAGITDSTEKNAINQLVLDFKSAGIWELIDVFYPFVGGTASSHKWNLKDPRDLDAAYRIVWGDFVIHNANGATGDGGYGNTFAPDNIHSNANKSVSIYQRNIPTAPSGVSAGALGGVSRFYLNFGGLDYTSLQQTQVGKAISSPNNGSFLITKNSTTGFNYFRRGVKTTVAGTFEASTAIWHLFAQANLTETSFANLASFHLGQYFNDTQAAAFDAAVAKFQTTLGRNV